MLLIEKYIPDVKAKKVQWSDLLRGELVSKSEFSPISPEYRSPKTYIKQKLGVDVVEIEDIIRELYKTQAPIEYVDVEETNGILVAIDYNEIVKGLKKFTHCEIHASTMLSAVAVNTPCADHNQAPRNIFSSGQCKQAIGVFATNFNSRIDTMTYVMNYPQKPLMATRYAEYTNFNTMGNGQNLIVAVATYTGYNQEDSIIFNKSSVERGMFNLTYYKNMVESEDENKNASGKEAIRFANPLKLVQEGKNLANLKFANYSKLDDNGFPLVNTYIKEGDAIIGRCKITTEYVEEEGSKNNIFNNKVKREVYEDKSIVADKTVSGIVDKVFVYLDNNNNKKLKIRFRKNRLVELGDKNCCYDKETEVLTDKGWMFFEHLTKEHKIATLVDNKLVYQQPIELQTFDFNGQLYKVDSNHVKLLVTDNHRMYVRTRNSDYKMEFARDCHGRVLHYKKNADVWEPKYDDVPCELVLNDTQDKVVQFKIPGYTAHSVKYDDIIVDIDDWLVFFGIWMAEGCAEDRTVFIAANKQRVKTALDVVCKNMEFKICKNFDKKTDEEEHAWCINKTTISRYLKQYSVGAVNKYLPNWVWNLNREQCQLLIDSMCLGDGHTMKNGTMRYDTSSTQLANDFQRLCLHAGYSANKCLKYAKGHQNIPHEGRKIQRTITNTQDAWRLTINTAQNEPIVNKYKYDGKMNDSWEDYEGKVYCCTVPNGLGVLYVRREGRPVWCGNSRHGQKGVCGAMIPAENMPFTKDGVVPDIIINPHAFPSRMTIGHMIECVLAKYGAMSGNYVDSTPFNNNDYASLYELLENKFGLERHANEILTNGFTGDQISTEIFIGPTYYQRLKHMVADKMNYRNTGPRTLRTRQPTQGRGNGGGLKIGEMEVNAILAHGLTTFLNESHMDRCDKYQYDIDNNSGNIAITNKKLGIYDGYTGEGTVPSYDFSTVQTPYAFKLFTQELLSMGIKPTVMTTSDYLGEIEEGYEDVEVEMNEDDEDF